MKEEKAAEIIDSEFDFGTNPIDQGQRETLISLLVRYGYDEEEKIPINKIESQKSMESRP